MGFHTRNLFTILLIFSVLIISTFQQLSAMRPLEGEQWLKKDGLVLESLPRGPVPPSGRSACTHIPGNGHGHCPLNEKHVAGHVARTPPVFPGVIVQFAAASLANETRPEEPSS